jgi:3-hydroxyacyl-[acyl-carrier-protein] dehydratase
VRFLFVDRILELERGKRILATKTVTSMDGFLTEHYTRRPLAPATLVIECLAQAGGWLNLISHDFRVKTVLALIEGVRILRDVRPGDTLLLDVHMLYSHADGATARAEAWVEADVVATIERMLFAHEVDTGGTFVRQQRDHFDYINGGPLSLTEPAP